MLNNIIDANGMGHAHHNGTKLTHRGLQVQAIFGFVRMMRAIQVGTPDAKTLVLWDGYAKHRFELLPTYKESREKRREEDPASRDRHTAYQAQVPVIQKAVTLLGFTQLKHKFGEADDLAGLLVKTLPGKKILRTGDTDWLQLVNEDTSWHDPREGGTKIDLDNFHQATGYFTPSEYLQGKALIGDSTDDIPPVGGVGKGTAPLLLAEHRSVENFFAAFDRGELKLGKKLRDFATGGRENFARNMALMDLRNPQLEDPVANMEVTTGAFDPDKFLNLCALLGFASITRNYREWIAPFELKAKS